LCCVAGCYKDSFVDRSLIFSTHTTLGLEASVQPTDAAAAPVSLVLGYKRTEGVLNPVYHADGVRVSSGDQGTTVKSRYRDKAYSVIAKLEGNTGGKVQETAEGQMSVAQWFATGEAATMLAGQPGIAGAVSGNSRIAEAAVYQRLARYATTDRDLRDRINAWLGDDDNVTKLEEWLEGRGVPAMAGIWVDDANTSKADLQAAIDKFDIP
jgi:hypothetical protein